MVPLKSVPFALCFIVCAAVPALCGSPIPPGQIPARWEGNSAVVLDDSLLFDLTSDNNENRIDIKEIRWYRLRHPAPAVLQEMKFHDQEFIEKRPSIEVFTYDSAGRRERVGGGCINRERSSEDFHVKYNLFVHKTGTYVTTVTVPSYDRVSYIRTELRRNRVKPAFVGRYTMRDEWPVLRKTVLVTVPAGMENVLGIVNGEGIAIDSGRTVTGKKTELRFSCGPLEALPEKPAIYSELWCAALLFRIPPRGAAPYSWRDIGDYYIDIMESEQRPSRAIDSVAATLPAQKEQTIEKAFDYVKTHTRYYGSWEGMHGFVPRDCGTVLANGYGDCKELAMLLRALLRGRGVTAYTALVSARPVFPQMVDAFPNLGVFNHMIVAVPSDTGMRYFDPTVTPSNAGNSYYATLNRKTLVLEKGASAVDSVAPRPGYRNRVVTVSSVVKRGSRWYLDGTIQHFGICALGLEDMLRDRTSHTEDALLAAYLRTAFGISPVSAAITRRSLDSVCVTFSCAFDEYTVRLPREGFILQVPSLDAWFARELADVVEGPWTSPVFEQTDTWCVPGGSAMRPSLNTLDNAVAQGAWRAQGDTLVRQFTSRRALYLSVKAPECIKTVEERIRFAKGTIWKK
jgi:hypothetical protein